MLRRKGARSVPSYRVGTATSAPRHPRGVITHIQAALGLAPNRYQAIRRAARPFIHPMANPASGQNVEAQDAGSTTPNATWLHISIVVRSELRMGGQSAGQALTKLRGY